MASVKYVVNGEVAVEVEGKDMEEVSRLAEAALVEKFPQLEGDFEVEITALTIAFNMPDTVEAAAAELEQAST